MSVASVTEAQLLPHMGYERALVAIDAFGGIEDLSPSVGSVLHHVVEQGSVSYSVRIPFASVMMTTDRGSGRCLIAGSQPRVVDSGDFLEDSLRDSFAALQSAVDDPVALITTSALRVALMQFLEAPTHRCCLEPGVATIPGLASAYPARARSLVGQALRTVRGNLQLRYLFCGAICGLLVFVLVHRLFGIAPGEAIPLALVPVVLAYVGACLSMRITVSSLASTPDFRRLLVLAMRTI
ncbi:MAG: hypothetical protein E6R08_00780 [Nevskiaceae bacterium]|nr:MAG: hypothetical protein E6R08_00780 [Nevskiaceae bacterium]